MQRHSRIALLGLWLLAASTSADADALLDGMQAWRAQDFSAARRHWQLAGDAGDAQAKYLLSQLYQRGQGGAADPKRALELLRESAEAGYAVACFNLGNHYQQGDGVPADPSQAARWWRRAAVQGLVPAQYNLGLLYYRGLGVEQDTQQAIWWYRQAAEQGSVRARKALQALGEPDLPVSTEVASPATGTVVQVTESGNAPAAQPASVVPATPVASIAPAAPAASAAPAKPPAEPSASSPPTAKAASAPVHPVPTHALENLQSLALGPDWLLRQPAGYYTVQVFASDDVTAVEGLLRKHRFTRQVAVYPFSKSGRVWYGVVYGRYATLGEARKAIADLPEALQKGGPWARKLGDLISIINAGQN